MRWCALLALTGSLLAQPSRAAAQRDLDIGMKMTKTSVLLGEPVWVDVNVTNRTHEALYLEFGVACMGPKPLKVQIPSAEPGPMELKRCGQGIAGACASGALPSVQPGETVTRRYVLDGDFQVARPGSYEVLLEKTVRYAPVALSPSGLDLNRAAERQQTASSTVVLEVNAGDAGKLLALEQEYARVAMERPMPPKLPAYVPAGAQTREEAAQVAMKRSLTVQIEASEARNAMFGGLAEHPVAGMEPVFRGWVAGHLYNAYGLLALRQLNTPAAREALADIAGPQTGPRDKWVEGFRWQAIDALADLGDRQYAPLLERLIQDSEASVHNAALEDLGRLGGEAELGLLGDIARTGSKSDRQLAIQSIGDTGSAKAVPLLIELAGSGDEGQPEASYFALRMLTHLDFPAPRKRSIGEVMSSWSLFWTLHQANARMYGPYDCGSPPFNPYVRTDGSR